MMFFLVLGFSTFAQGKQEATIMTSAECDMCKETIEKALVYTKGVKSANLDVESKKVTVVYNSKKTNLDKIKAVISKVGYDADELSADKEAYKNLPSCCKKDGMKMQKDKKKGCCTEGKSKCADKK